MNANHQAALAVLVGALRDLLGAAADHPALPRCSEQAEALAARARTLTQYQPPRPDRMLPSIFNLVPGTEGAPRFFRPGALTDTAPTTHTEHEPVAPADLRLALQNDLPKAEITINQALFLLEKWAWAVPVAGEPTGIPFAEQARLTAAVAAALAESDQVVLIGADIPGIQDFIYTISAKGALRSLRARSFYVERLAEDGASRLLAALGLSRANLLFTAGGHFYILAPAHAACRQAVAAFAAEMNQRLHEEAGRQLSLAVGLTDGFDPAELATAGGAARWAEVQQRTRQARQQRLHEQMKDPKFFEPFPPLKDACHICRQETNALIPLGRPEPDSPETLACPFCYQLHADGGRLANMQTIPETSYVINRLTTIGPEHVPIWMNTYAATDADGVPDDFTDLANAATGAKLLGVLRMDVDSLGSRFRQPWTLLQRMSLSRALTRFFKLHLAAICAGRQISVIYAGGDDLFLVGAWNQLAELAFIIRKAFDAYTGGRLTLSGGLLAADPKLPIHHLAEEGKKAEKAAKALPGKNGIALLWPGSDREGPEGRVIPSAMPWPKAEELHKAVFTPVISAASREDGRMVPRLPRSFIYRLLGLSDTWLEHGPLYLPKMAYAFARTDQKTKQLPEWQALRAYLWDLNRGAIAYLPAMLRWIDLLSRGGNELGTETESESESE